MCSMVGSRTLLALKWKKAIYYPPNKKTMGKDGEVHIQMMLCGLGTCSVSKAKMENVIVCYLHQPSSRCRTKTIVKI